MSTIRETRQLRWIVAMIALAIAAILAAANAHLVYVAFDSQPTCVDHIKDRGDPGSFRAAKSSC